MLACCPLLAYPLVLTSHQIRCRFCHICLEQSVSLSDWSTHSFNTRLLAWQQCVDQSENSCEEVLSKFKQYFSKPNSAPKRRCDRISPVLSQCAVTVNVLLSSVKILSGENAFEGQCSKVPYSTQILLCESTICAGTFNKKEVLIMICCISRNFVDTFGHQWPGALI